MGYRNWATRNNSAIQATSAIISAIGIVAVAASLVVSVISLKVASNALEENKRATQAAVSFNVQRFAFEFLRDVMASVKQGQGSFTLEKDGSKVATDDIKRFLLFLDSHEIIFSQRELRYIPDPIWEGFERNICFVARSKIADLFFQKYSIEERNFNEEYKRLIVSCRSEEGPNVSAP